MSGKLEYLYVFIKVIKLISAKKFYEWPWCTLRERERERERETERDRERGGGGREAAFRLTVHACRYADLFSCAWSNVTTVLYFIPAIKSSTMVTLDQSWYKVKYHGNIRPVSITPRINVSALRSISKFSISRLIYMYVYAT